jgi:hypothetical protein
MSKLIHTLKVTRSAILITFVGSLSLMMLLIPSSWATSIGVLESSQPNGLGEVLEPLSRQPTAPSALEGLSKQQDKELDELKSRFIEGSGETPEFSHSIADVALIPDFADSLTALEWVRQWADTGFWLESDQWADFRAIAIASYSPDIQYWLGRDRWASFGAMPFGTLPNGPPLSVSTSTVGDPTNISSISNISDSGYGSIYPHKSGNSKSTTESRAGPITLLDLILSMAKKIARQPIFYLILLIGAGLLIWAFRRQAST